MTRAQAADAASLRRYHLPRWDRALRIVVAPAMVFSLLMAPSGPAQAAEPAPRVNSYVAPTSSCPTRPGRPS
ncbi:hypothetical protein [Microbacterium sp. NIBRBAC000506063]|uniref:hypothetical protein n=1 Tax=Microbacterium sp. NIBRBAC000506063 TaxID=2734618 RepID=UPI001BB653F1|nr:hypothetical protein [Microbacterium sp. NIBRBAC000506063]QTV78931.1 hypothetical protein KAE78_06930 [Microbacterium sp. NIBRBAC000506063]